MNPNFYRFESTWRLRAPSAHVYAVLEAVEHYPDWWPEIRQAERSGDGSGRMRARSFLPYDLNFSLSRTRQDPQMGILEARLEGDLEGFSRWSLSQLEDVTVANFHEEVVVNRTWLRRLAPIARPAFRLNHRLMMRHGHRGLQTYLFGYQRASDGARLS